MVELLWKTYEPALSPHQVPMAPGTRPWGARRTENRYSDTYVHTHLQQHSAQSPKGGNSSDVLNEHIVAYVYIIKYYVAMRSNEVHVHATNEKTSKMLCSVKKPRTKDNIQCDSSYMKCPE